MATSPTISLQMLPLRRLTRDGRGRILGRRGIGYANSGRVPEYKYHLNGQLEVTGGGPGRGGREADLFVNAIAGVPSLALHQLRELVQHAQ
jgi:hypothetical protein